MINSLSCSTDKVLFELQESRKSASQGEWKYDRTGDMIFVGRGTKLFGHICDIRGAGQNLPMDANANFIVLSANKMEDLLAVMENWQKTFRILSLCGWPKIRAEATKALEFSNKQFNGENKL